MKGFFERRNGPGFTLIEMMVVIAVAAIVFTIGLIGWKKAQVGRQFDTDFDTLVATLQSARTFAAKYGSPPENFSGSSTPTHGKSYDRHICRLVINGINDADQIKSFKNIKISYDANGSYALPAGGMTQNLIDGNFKGVALLFGSESGNSYSYDSTILFNPDGSVCYTPFVTPPSEGIDKIKIIMETTDNSKKAEILLDRNTGTITTNKIK